MDDVMVRQVTPRRDQLRPIRGELLRGTSEMAHAIERIQDLAVDAHRLRFQGPDRSQQQWKLIADAATAAQASNSPSTAV